MITTQEHMVANVVINNNYPFRETLLQVSVNKFIDYFIKKHAIWVVSQVQVH